MAEKTLVVAVCDLPHRNDRQAVAKITIDVCAHHQQLIAATMTEDMAFECSCGYQSMSHKGIVMHQVAHRRNGQAKEHKEIFELEGEPA